MTKSGQDGMDEKLQLPKVSVILAARDEERNIQKCLDSLVSQEYPSYEIIAVDDASTDGTTVIICKYATASPSKVIAVIRREKDNPPEGWTGKNWACFQGYQASSGQILLFSDADTVYSSDTISLAIKHMTNENLDALTARPRIFSDNLLTKIVLPLVWMVSHVFYSAMKVNNPKSKTGFVFGGFYLITRKAYESLGTHKSIKSEFTEDLEIGRRLKHESKGTVSYEKSTSNAHHNKYHLKMFLGNQSILNSWAPDNAALYNAVRRTVIPSFRKQPALTCLSGVVQFFILVFPWIVLPISAFSFLSFWNLNSGTNHLLSSSILLLLSLDLATLCFIFASSFVISKLSLLQNPKYVWASPVACFYIFCTTALSIIAAAGTASISWKNRTYESR